MPKNVGHVEDSGKDLGQPTQNVPAEGGIEVKKLSIFIPASLHLRARRYAMLTDQTLTNLVTTLLSDYLDVHDGEGPSGVEDPPAAEV